MGRSSSFTAQWHVVIPHPPDKNKGRYAEEFMQALDQRGPNFQKCLMDLAGRHSIFLKVEQDIQDVIDLVKKIFKFDLCLDMPDDIATAIGKKFVRHTFKGSTYTEEYRQMMVKKLHHVFLSSLP